MEFVKVAEASEIPLGHMKMVKVEGKEILIANFDGNYYAIGDKCTHEGADLSKGKFEKNEVVCPWHKARFDVTNGKVTFQPKVLFRQLHLEDEPSYEVKLDGNSILVKV